jgi:hypothetical protein
MNAHCGGCRARAYGMTGDLMAEDPLCTHTPGRFAGSPLLKAQQPALAGPGGARMIQYGAEPAATIAWDEDASARMKKIPAFVRGMVMKAVEDSCRKNGIGRVTIEELEKIRARLPPPIMFGTTAPYGAPAGAVARSTVVAFRRRSAPAIYRNGSAAASTVSLTLSSIHFWNSSAVRTLTKPRMR